MSAKRVLPALALALALCIAASAFAAAVSWSVGDDVMALGKDGAWYYAQVIEVKGDLYRVDIVGISKEWMDASRIRPRTADEIRAVTGGEPEPAAPASKPGDERVAKALREAGITPKTDGDGDFRLELETEGGRTQLVYVISETQSWGEIEIREVWSPAFHTKGNLDLAMARRLFEDNNNKKLGAWRILGTGDKEVAAFAVHFDANAKAGALKDILDLVKKVADDMEKEVEGADNL